jgi:phosphatidylglycerophosphatase A
MQKLITLFGINNRIVASIIALAIGLAVALMVGVQTLFMLMILLSIITVFEGNKYCGSKLDKCHLITLDTFIGVFFALSIALESLTKVSNALVIITTLLTLVAYIAMDRYRPSTIKWLRENVKGALGVVLSTLLAGMASGMLVILVLKIKDLF